MGQISGQAGGGTLMQGLANQGLQAPAWQAGPTSNVLGQLLNGQQGGLPQPMPQQRQFLPGFGQGTQIGQVQGPPLVTPPTNPYTPGATVPPGTTGMAGQVPMGWPQGLTPDQVAQLQGILGPQGDRNPMLYALMAGRLGRRMGMTDADANVAPGW